MINCNEKINNNLESKEKIRWNPYYKIIKVSSDELYITHGLRSVFSFSVLDKLGLGVLDKVADLLQSFISMEELIEKIKIRKENENYLIDLLSSLYKNGVVQKEKETLNFCYSVYYENSEGISGKKIGVVGSGPLSIRNILSIMSLEVKKINILLSEKRNKEVDKKALPILLKDYLEQSENYINSLKKFFDDKGLEEKIGMISEFHKENLKKILEVSDVILVSFENYFPSFLYEINSLAHEIRKPVLFSFIDGGLGVLGPLVTPGETACFTCFANALEASILHPSYYIPYKSYMEKKEGTFDIAISGAPPIYDIMSGFTLDSLIRFLMDPISSPVLNRVILLNFESLEIDIQDLLKNPYCPICSKLEPPLLSSTVF